MSLRVTFRLTFWLACVVAASGHFPLPSEALLTCDTAVVGGGWAGVYAAWRLAVDSAAVRPGELCLFEARSGVGGRTYSVHLDVSEGEPLVVDVGAYRFSKQQHLPADLILHLNLSSQCYKPDCATEDNMTLYRIVDDDGDSRGYDTAMRVMVEQLEAAGARLFFNHELTAILRPAGAASTCLGEASPMHLSFRNGAQVQARSVLLNIPRNEIKRLREDSLIFDSPLSARLLRNCTSIPLMAFKVYVVYEDPWWLTKLNISEGYFSSPDREPRFYGRYHDGAIRRLPGGRVGAGALEVLYNYTTDGTYDWYLKYRQNKSDPLTISQDPDLLSKVHARLMEFHAESFAAKHVNASAISPPMKVVMGLWGNVGFLTNPMPANVDAQFRSYPKEACLGSISPDQYIAAVSSPTDDLPCRHRVFVANDDYFWATYSGSGCCWAENSLKPAEKLLHDRFALAKPTWLDAGYYASDVLRYGHTPEPSLEWV